MTSAEKVGASNRTLAAITRSKATLHRATCGSGGRASRHHEIEGFAHPDKARQALGTTVAGEQTEGRLGQPEHVLAFSTEAKVAGQGHLQSTSESGRPDLGDEHFRGACYLGEASVGLTDHAHIILDAVGVERLDVRPCGEEPLTAAAQDHSSGPGVLCRGAHALA